VACSGRASREELRRRESLGATHGAALEQWLASGGTARRPTAAQSRGRGPAEEEEEQGAPGAVVRFQKFEGPYCKPKFPAVLKLQCRNGQNKSCRTFQTLQLLFRVQLQKLKGWSFILKLCTQLKLFKVFVLS
jgi:hypothetical protein